MDNWTYPLIQPKLIEEAQKRGFYKFQSERLIQKVRIESMLYLFKPLPSNDKDFSTWKPFIKNVWFRKALYEVCV